MADLKASVELHLKDKLSSAVKGAAANVQRFGSTASQVARVSGRAFDSLGAKIGGLGLAFGAFNIIKFNTDYEDKLIRMGTAAGATAAETNALRRKLLAVAADAKISVDGLVSFGNALAENSIGLEEIRAAAPLAASAIQGLGMSGENFGTFYNELANRGASLDVITEKLNNITEMNSKAKGGNITQFGNDLAKILEVSGGKVDDLEDIYRVILTLNNGVSDTEAISRYEKAMQEFASNDIRDKVRKNFAGFDLKDAEGNVKSFSEIADTLITQLNDRKLSIDRLDEMGFSKQTIFALKTYNNHYQDTIDKVGELGDTQDAVSRRARKNAESIKSNLQSLQTSLNAIGGEILMRPLQWIAKVANENPQGLKFAIYGIGTALVALSTMKAFSTVFNFVTQLRSMRAPKIGGLGSGGIPVYVTNGGMGAGNLLDGTPLSGGNKALNHARAAVGKVTPGQYAAGGVAMGLFAAVLKIPQMMGELNGIKENEDLTAKERGKAEGGAIGDAAGGIIGGILGGVGGVAAGAAAGAAIGSIIPGLGTVIGGLVGAGVGWLGMKAGSEAGRWVGEKIGGSLASDNESIVPQMEDVPRSAMEHLRTPETALTIQNESVVIGTEITLKDDRIDARTRDITHSKLLSGYAFQTGLNFDARIMP